MKKFKMKKVLFILALATSLSFADNYVKSEWVQEGFTTKVEGRSVTFSRWHHEAELKVTYDGDEKLKVTKSELGTDVDILLSVRPAANSFSFTLGNFANFDFFEQKGLNEEEHVRATFCTANDCYNDKHEVIYHREDDVIDSIAVYHKTLRDHWIGHENYEAGKFTHIFRAKAIDANGKWAYGKLRVVKDKLIEEFPETFLSSASYPVVLDPSFGYRTLGASDDNPADNWSWFKEAASSTPKVSPATPAVNGALINIVVYGRLKSGAPHFSTSLYSDNASSPNNKLVSVDPPSGFAFPAANALITTAISYGSITASAQYWIGITSEYANGAKDSYFRFDTNGGATENYYQNTLTGVTQNGAWPSTPTVPMANANERATLYGVYTATTKNGNGATYTTSFPSTEEPINESSSWLGGSTDGVDWKDVKTTTNLAFGMNLFDGTNYDDSTAVMNGTWNADQQCTATVYRNVATVTQDSNTEVECRLRSNVSPKVNSGYECNWNTDTVNNYREIVVWDGTLSTTSSVHYTVLSHVTTGAQPATGDIVKCKIVGTQITSYLNGSQIASVSDATWATGNPGIGMWLHNNTGTVPNSDFGFSAVTFNEISSATAPKRTLTLNIGNVFFNEIHKILSVRN